MGAALWMCCATAQTPLVAAAEPVYDFGAVKQGTRIQHDFKLRNAGAAPLRVSAAELSGPGMKVRVVPAVMPPGAEGTATIEWATNQVAGAVTGVARIRWDGLADAELPLTLKGSVIPPVSIEPMPAVFLSTFTNEPTQRVLIIRNNDDRPLAYTRVEPAPHVAASLATVEAGKVFALTVRCAPDTPVGRYEGSLTLSSDEPETAPITLPVHLWVKADLYANPDTVDFGAIRRDDLQRADAAVAVTTQTLYLKKRAGDFQIVSIASDSPVVAVKHAPSGSSDSFAIDVRLRPGALAKGKFSAQLRIVTSDPEFREVVIPVTGTVL